MLIIAIGCQQGERKIGAFKERARVNSQRRALQNQDLSVGKGRVGVLIFSSDSVESQRLLEVKRLAADVLVIVLDIAGDVKHELSGCSVVGLGGELKCVRSELIDGDCVSLFHDEEVGSIIEELYEYLLGPQLRELQDIVRDLAVVRAPLIELDD